jgi:hypothetical protein
MNPQLELRDIHLPPEPSWWPPAPGWLLLALLLVVVAWVLVRFLRQHWRARRRRLALQSEFDAALGLADPQAQLAAISQLLRRAARVHAPAAAALIGEAWLEFLDQAGGTEPAFFTRGAGRLLEDGPYRPAPDAAQLAALLAPARHCFLTLAGPP